MIRKMDLNLFAISIENKEQTLWDVNIYGEETLEVLTKGWAAQCGMFVNPEDRKLKFDPGYSLSKGQIFSANPYSVPSYINKIYAPDTIGDFSISGEGLHSLKAFVAHVATEQGENLLLFQRFMSSQIIRENWSFEDFQNRFRLVNKRMLTLGNKLDAVFRIDERELLFRSYQVVNPFLSLESFFKESSEEEICEWLSHDMLMPEDIDATLDNLDQTMRRRFSMLRESNVLDVKTAEEIRVGCAKYGLLIEVHEDKLVFPKEKAKSKDLLKYLNDEFYTGENSGEKYVTNSKTKVATD